MTAIGQVHFSMGKLKNKEEAIKWYKQAVDKGNRTATTLLGNLYTNELFTLHKPKLGLELLRKAAEQGDSSAYFYLAEAFQHGNSAVDDDKKEAFKLYLKAAKMGCVEAFADLALCYFNGEGTPENQGEGCKWVAAAQQSGTPTGTFLTALTYRDGLCGQKEDLTYAQKLMENAAENNQKHARELRTTRRVDDIVAQQAAENAVRRAQQAAQAERENEIANQQSKTQVSDNGNSNVTMESAVSDAKQAAVRYGYRKLREEGKVESGGSYSYEFGMEGKFSFVLIIPYAITNRTPIMSIKQLDYRNTPEYSYQSDFQGITQYNNMTVIKMNVAAPTGSTRKFQITVPNNGYFMIFSD
jgi:hypothetical protein